MHIRAKYQACSRLRGGSVSTGGQSSAVRHMLRKRRGRIINITSVAGQIGNAGQTNYSASKAGQIGFTKALAREVASRGITVNAVAPGYIETEVWAGVPEATSSRL